MAIAVIGLSSLGIFTDNFLIVMFLRICGLPLRNLSNSSNLDKTR